MPEKKKHIGRPKKTPSVEVEVVDEEAKRLEMNKKNSNKDVYYTVEAVGAEWRKLFGDIIGKGQSTLTEKFGSSNAIVNKWNELNPFLQNERIKRLYTQAKQYTKTDISTFLQSPGGHEEALRSVAWSNSGSQQIYYNILRRSCDIPLYKYFVIPEYSVDESLYKSKEFEQENALVHSWLELFNVPNTFKTMALQVKREGKQSYILRNSFDGTGAQKKPCYAALQKLPTDWVKITGIGQLGYTVSFNMMYFMQLGNYPSFYGEFIEQAWEDMLYQGVIIRRTDNKGEFLKYDLDINKARNYSFEYCGTNYSSTIEIKGGTKKRKELEYLFWIKMPYDICYTFGSDNSNPWAAPDTMGLLQKLQELSDYGTLAGLIASTPLTAVLTGEIETVNDPKPGKNESVYSPEIIKGMQDLFNSVTSTNVEAWMWPAKNIKLQQLSSDVNSSEIVTKATENFIVSAGDSGLTITTDKPNVSQVKTAQLLAAAQQEYVTLQFTQVLNFILQHKLGFKYKWKVNIWGDVFSFENQKKYLKELVAGGAVFLLPKLASAEDLSMRDTKALTKYVQSLDIYKDFATLTMDRNHILNNETVKDAVDDVEETTEGTGQVGRPKLDDSDIENDATAADRDQGTDTADNRDSMSKRSNICPVCGKTELEEGQIVCEECLERIEEQ